MTNYRQTMADAYGQVKLNTEANDFGLSGTITDTQLANLKKVWATKSKKDITPGIKSMIAKLDVPTQVAVKHAKINVISDLIEATEDHEVSMAIGQLKTISQYASKLQSILQSKGDDYNIEAWVQSKITSAEDYMNSVGHYMENNPDVNEQLEENFSASQIARLKKEYEVMRGKKISIANANKLSQMFKNIPDSGLVDIFKADIPFLSVMAMTKMIQKNIPRPAGVKLRLEEVEILDEATQNEIEITEGKIDGKKFDSLKKGDTMTITYNSTMSGTTVKKFVVKNKTRSAKYNTDKVKLEIEGKPGTSPFYLYKRKNGDVSFAQGDMAATVVAVKEETLVEFTTQQIKMAYGVANDKRYKGDNYSGAIAAIEKIAKGLSSHPAVQNVLKRTNENLDEGKMSQIDQMQKDGKSAAEIAKLMKLDVKTVKSILGEEVCPKCDGEGCEHCNNTGYHKEETLHEFKKMTVTIKDPAKREKAIQDVSKALNVPGGKGFILTKMGDKFKVDGKGADLNKFATDLKNFYKADIRAESYNIDESADEDFYNPVYEACWVGYKKVGMKKKGDKMLPNCVPEETIKEEDDPNKLSNELKQKENEIAQLKQKAETEKAKNVQKSTQKMVNPETGEPLLQVGIAYKHLKSKMAKDAAAKDDAEQKEKEEKKKTLAKFKDRIKEEALIESEASDKAKAMGLDYMKFGRYSKDGKVTHKTVGDTLQKVDDKGEPVKDDKPKKDEPSKDEPKADVDVKPKVDPFDAQKDLEDMVTDGMIDVEDDGQGGLTATKEYEPSQDYEAESDVKSIKQYFKDKGIDEKDIYVDVESEEDYIQVNVEIRGKKVDEDVDYLKPRMNPSQLANIKNVWKHKTKKDVTPAVKQMIKNMDVPTQLAIKDAGINLLSDLVEVTKDGAYAIGMSQAKKKYNDEPPLDKKTITKGHEIAKSILKKEETIIEFTSQQIKQAYGIANDPRYKQGNYTGAVAAIEKLAKGLSRHPDVQKVLKRTNENAEHPAKEVFEQIEGLKNKAEKSGMPYSILKKVYDRGMAAWRGGHRPGASQQQWAFARVNSFITKSSGTWGGADKDLAAKVKGK